MRTHLVAMLALVLICCAAGVAFGDKVRPGQSGYVLTATESQSGSTEQLEAINAGEVAGAWHQEPQCAYGIGGAETCAEPALCDNGEVMVYTWFQDLDGERYNINNNCPEEAVPQPQVTPGLVLRALRRIPLPASELVVQPPGGRTLVNFETNFYTEQGEFTRVVRLLGRRVVLRIWPGSFTWVYGDGSSERTSSAGSPYPDLEITHRYLVRGRVAVRVDTTYGGVPGGWGSVAWGGGDGDDPGGCGGAAGGDRAAGAGRRLTRDDPRRTRPARCRGESAVVGMSQVDPIHRTLPTSCGRPTDSPTQLMGLDPPVATSLRSVAGLARPSPCQP